MFAAKVLGAVALVAVAATGAGGSPDTARARLTPQAGRTVPDRATSSARPGRLLHVVHDVLVPSSLQPAYAASTDGGRDLFYVVGRAQTRPPYRLVRFDTHSGTVTTALRRVGALIGGEVTGGRDYWDVASAHGRARLERYDLRTGRMIRGYDAGPAPASSASVVVAGKVALVQVDRTLQRVDLTSGRLRPSQGAGTPQLVRGRGVLLGTLTRLNFPGESDLSTGALLEPSGLTSSDLPASFAAAGRRGVYLLGDNEGGGPSPGQKHLNEIIRLDPRTLRRLQGRAENLGVTSNHFLSVAAVGDRLLTSTGECGHAGTGSVCVYDRDPVTLAVDPTPVLRVPGDNGRVGLVGNAPVLSVERADGMHLLTLSS